MRKRLSVILIIVLGVVLVSCKKSGELSDFSKAFKNYNYSKTTGHRYTKTQRLDNIIIYEETLDVKINRGSLITAHKYYYLKELSEFNLENQFKEVISNEYYYKDSIGVISEEDIIWSKSSFNEFSENITLPNFSFKKTYFKEHTLTKLSDYLLLKAHIKDEHTKDFFNITDAISNIYIEVRILGTKLQEFMIQYTLDNTMVEVGYRIYYNDHELNIKYE